MVAVPDESLPEYSLAEVRKHGDPDDLWMILYNKVYDVTTFPSVHPGGAEVLFDCGGVDATVAFEDVGHSKNACDMLSPFLIGKIPVSAEKSYKQSEKHLPSKKKSTRRGRPFAGDASLWVLVLLALLACVGILCLQKLKWASITS